MSEQEANAKKRRIAHEEEEEKKTPLKRPRLSKEKKERQEQLRTIVVTRLEAYFSGQRFPLLKITERINRLEDRAEFITAFAELVLRQQSLEHSITFALQTYMRALEALVYETQMALASRFDNGRSLNRDVALRLSVQKAPISKFIALKELVAIVLRGDETDFDTQRIYRDVVLLALYNDQQLKHLERYEEAGDESVTLFVARINGRLVCAMIVPRQALSYTLQINESPYRDSYRKLHEEAVRLALSERAKEAEIVALRKKQRLLARSEREKDAEIVTLRKQLSATR